MIRHLYLLIFFVIAAAGQLRAQCSTDAGTLSDLPANQCEGISITASHAGNEVLDSNDVLVFVVYIGADPQTGTVLATSSNGTFAYDPAFLDNSPVSVAAVAGNNNGQGSVDWSDPCLSVSIDLVVQFHPSPEVTATGGVLNCNSTSVTITASSDLPGVTFTWTGPAGFNSTLQNPITNSPGLFCVTVTTTFGCTASECAVVVQNSDAPIVTPVTPAGLPCDGGNTTLEVALSCSQCIVQWTGPGIVSGVATLNPTVNQPGTYLITATNTANGCTTIGIIDVLAVPIIPPSNFVVTQVSCQGQSDGDIQFTLPAAGVPPFNITWTGPGNFTSTQQNITGLVSGTYTVNAIDFTGCTYIASLQLNQPASMSIPVSQQIITPVTCFGLNNGAINMTVVSVLLPLTYQWAGPNGFTSTTQDLTGIPAGTYVVTVTNGNGCTLVSSFVVNQPAIMIIDIDPVNCGLSSLLASVTSGSAPYVFNWNDGNITAVVQDPLPGTYAVTVTDANGCTAIGSYLYTGATADLCGTIEGRLVRDSNINCESNVLEPGMAGWIVEAVDGSETFYGVTNDSGYYRISVEEGNYILEVTPSNDQLWLVCTPDVAVGQVNPDDTLTVPDIPIQKILDCPLLEVSVSSGFLRRCFSNNFYYVNYCNNGTVWAENANIVLELDPFLSIESSNAMYTDLGNNQFQFEVGDLDIGDCGTFFVQVLVSCDALLGQTHCVTAIANPHECIPADPLWSGASLTLRSECTTDSVFFIIKNTGIGNMSADAEYIVIEDAVMRAMGIDLRLNSGDSMRIAVPANGATWRVEVTQEPLHPGSSQPSLSVEGCSETGAFSTGFATQYPNDDDDPWIDIDCRQNIGAYDPNDKQGFPIGYGAQRYIKPGTDIEYLIRFQNTGTDTAFNVYVLDTLSTWLDPASIRLGASSHPFVFDVYGNGILKFDFPNIMLPDSNVNEPLSNGFVQFRIAHREDAPLETVIENSAAIYFDFNEPIITNTTEHRLGENFISVSSWEVLRNGVKLDVAPNPSMDVARVTVNGLRGGEDLRLRVCDLQGRVVREVSGTAGVFEMQRRDLPSGVYMLVLFVDGQAAGNGKMVVASH